MLRKGIDGYAAATKNGEQERRKNHTDRMSAPEERNRNTSEPVIVGEPVVISMAVTEHLVDSDHAGEAAGDRHRQDDLPPHGNTAVLCRRRIAAGRAQLVPPV